MQAALYENLSTVCIKLPSSSKNNLYVSGREGSCSLGIERLCTFIVNDLPQTGCNSQVKEEAHDKA